MFQVDVGQSLAAQIANEFAIARSASGTPSETDFWSGPLKAALIAFRDFESLRYEDIPQVRKYVVVDRTFGPVVFVGVLVAPTSVELAEYAYDPDYWRLIEDEPDD
jgi:hypothetical protein